MGPKNKEKVRKNRGFLDEFAGNFSENIVKANKADSQIFRKNILQGFLARKVSKNCRSRTLASMEKLAKMTKMEKCLNDKDCQNDQNGQKDQNGQNDQEGQNGRNVDFGHKGQRGQLDENGQKRQNCPND